MNPYRHIIEFVEALRKEGFHTGVDTYLQVAAVCRSLPPDTNEALLCDYLCPLFAADAASQQRFRDCFSNYASLLIAPDTIEELPDIPHDPGSNTDGTKRERGRGFYLVVFAVVLIIAGIIIYWAGSSDSNPDVQVKPDVPVTTETPAKSTPVEIVGCTDPNSINYNPAATVSCTDCCRYSEPVSDFQVPDSLSAAPRFSFIDVPAPGISPIYGKYLQWLSRYKTPIQILLFFILFGLALGYFMRRSSQQRYLARQSRTTEPPYRLPIKIRHDRLILLADEFPVAVNRLKTRQFADRFKLNLHRTITATIHRGGLLTPRFEALTKPVEYILLIDKSNEQNHQAQLFEYIYQYLVKQEVHVERYFYDGNPLYCWNEHFSSAVPVERIIQRRGDARLLVLGDGYSFIDPVTGDLEDNLKVLAPWKQRALLTPAAVAGWNYREAILSRFFTILPSSLEGIVQLVREFESLPTPSLREWKYDLGKDDKPITLPETDLVSSLQKQIGPDLTRWVTACAIYPELHWDLTLELGNTLSDAAPESEPLPSFQNLLTLSRIPWFRRGYMPPEVRSQLLGSTQLTPGDRDKVRAAIIHILENNAPSNQDSFAAEEHRLHLVLNRMMVAKMSADRRKWMEDYRKLHGKGIHEDSVSMAEVDRNFNKLLDFPLPQRLLEALFPFGRKVLGWRSGVPLVMATALAAVIWSLGHIFIPQSCTGTLAELPDKNEAFCLESPEDSLAFNAVQAEYALGHYDLGVVRVLCNQVHGWSVDSSRFTPRSIDTLFYRPVQIHIWNTALKAYYDRDYPLGLELLKLLRWCMELQNPGIGTQFNDNISLYSRSLEAEGICRFFMNEVETAKQIADSITANQPRYFAERAPNLRLLLDYDYVDTLSQNRIRVRKAQKYGFLDEHGVPLWDGNQLPFDHAFHFYNSEAIIIVDSQQCRVGLDCKVDFTRCHPVEELDKEPSMVLIPGGTFYMGSESGDADEKPVHKVILSDFYLGTYEVTVAEYRLFINSTGYKTNAEKGSGSYIYVDGSWDKKAGINWRNDTGGKTAQDNHPVIHVSWNDAKAYCDWLSEKSGKTYRLPTEAEWEYGARGGNQSKGYEYAGSNNVGDVGCYSSNSGNKTHAVGEKLPNELGLYDMTGNVWEWCSDWYGAYPFGSQTNPTGPTSGSYRVMRGGSWNVAPRLCRVAYRSDFTPGYRSNALGFRLARTK